MKKLNVLPVSLSVLLLGLLVVWAVSACTDIPISPTDEPPSPLDTPIPSPVCPEADADTKSISFETLTQGFRLTSTYPGPALYRAIDPSSLDVVTAIVDTKDQALVEAVKVDATAVLAAVWGVRSSGGGSITICGISLDDTNLTVSVILQENDPNVAPVDAATYPYHLVLVNRLDLPEGSLHYRLVSDTGLLAEGDLP